MGVWDETVERIANHSLKIEPGHNIYVHVIGDAEPLLEPLYRTILARGGVPHLHVITIEQLKAFIAGSSVAQLTQMAELEKQRFQSMDSYFGIRADQNAHEMEDIPRQCYEDYLTYYQQPFQMAMAAMKRWVLMKFPTAGMAQLAKMSLNEFSRLYRASCELDYSRLSVQAEPLRELLDKTDRVRILSPGTDIEFSIRGIPSYICDGKYNLPDGEIFTAPIAHTVCGKIKFNVPTIYQGVLYDQVECEFDKGNLVRVSSRDDGRLAHILQTDPGASRIGEFGIGLNPVIKQPTGSMIMDEKMTGSIHLAFGQSYPMAYNGNESSIHWDMVLCQLEEQGGGELYFDGVLVGKDGKFMHKELLPLHSER